MAYMERSIQFGMKKRLQKGKFGEKRPENDRGMAKDLGGNRGSEMGRIQIEMKGKYGRAGK